MAFITNSWTNYEILRLINPSLAHIYCSTLLSNHGLIMFKRAEVLECLFFYEQSIRHNPMVEVPRSSYEPIWYGPQQILINIFNLKRAYE